MEQSTYDYIYFYNDGEWLTKSELSIDPAQCGKVRISVSSS